LQSLYEVKSSEDGLTYYFTTKFNLTYIVALTTNGALGVNAYSLNIYPEDDTIKPPIDFWIKNTVIDIIGRILIKEENSLVYVCDGIDGKEDKRHTAFARWYDNGKRIYPDVRKYDYCFHSEDGYKINASLMYNQNNPLAQYLIEQFNELMGLY